MTMEKVQRAKTSSDMESSSMVGGREEPLLALSRLMLPVMA